MRPLHHVASEDRFAAAGAQKSQCMREYMRLSSTAGGMVFFQGVFALFRTPVRSKRKARDCAIAVAMARECNAVIGVHRRPVAGIIKCSARQPAPVGCVAALAKGVALDGALRLATNTGSLAEHDKYTLKQHLYAERSSDAEVSA